MNDDELHYISASDALRRFRDRSLSPVELMTAIITRAVQGTERHEPTAREVRVARILMQVWLSSLNGWVCGVDGPERVDEDLDAAARLLLA